MTERQDCFFALNHGPAWYEVLMGESPPDCEVSVKWDTEKAS